MFRAGYHFGMTYVHDFFDARVLCVAEDICALLKKTYGGYGLFVFTSLLTRLTRMNRFIPHKNGAGVVGPFSGTLYMPPLQVEREPLGYLRDKVETHRSCAKQVGSRQTLATTQSATDLRQIPDSTVDYVFVDPPFGSNLIYSELNFMIEHWLDVFTNAAHEAIQSEHQSKRLEEYRALMLAGFRNIHRVLKPGRWLTVEFHNSNNAVWHALQTALWESGFVVADVRVLDKRKITMLQGTHAGIAKQDLVISAYKPDGAIEKQFGLAAGSAECAWTFVRGHLRQLPRFVASDGRVELIAERQNFLLFDRMVAFHVRRGVTVPLSTADFYAGLEQRFPSRDGMYFLEDQVAEYDKKRLTVGDIVQLEISPCDEASSIEWLRQLLSVKPQTFQDLHPLFLKAIGGWERYETPLELSELLEENFLRYDGTGDVPSQVHRALTANLTELRGVANSSPALVDRARDRWYVPDPTKQADLIKLREKALLREFAEYVGAKRGKLKQFRSEAVRAGFKTAYDSRDYKTIVTVAANLPESIMQEDEKLMMYFDVASMRLGEV